MKLQPFDFRFVLLALAFGWALPLACLGAEASTPQEDSTPTATTAPSRGARSNSGGRRSFGPGGMGGMQQHTALVKQFDKDSNGRLSSAERKAAREFLAAQASTGRGSRRMGPRGPNANQIPPPPGRRLTPADIKSFPDALLYDPGVLRTLFLDFENTDWEKELGDFYHTDVDVPAKLTVDGEVYPDVGVHFRGASSFFTVGEGRKRSLNLSVDFANPDQRLGGYRTLNLLNSHTDPTFLRSVLYYQVARDYIPAPKANFVRVVINGESWGVYVSMQQFNKDFVTDWFGTSKGARWKVPGSPRASAGLTFLGEDVAQYRRHYEIKTKDNAKSWAHFIHLCRVLNEEPADKLESALMPRLDIDGTLKFLALDIALINDDGYWIRSSDYGIYEDQNGRFHLIPQDANESFRIPEGPGMSRSVAVKGVELDPLTGADDLEKPLLSKLLAVPALRTRYLKYVRAIAEQSLDWAKLGPVALQYQSLIADDVKTDTRKLDSFEAFTKGLTEDTEQQGFRGRERVISIKNFVEQRRIYLLNHPEVKKAGSL